MSTDPAAPEFSRIVDIRSIPATPVTLTATDGECIALAARFGLVSLQRLEAVITLEAEGAVVSARGRLRAAWVQPCAISGEDLAQSADEDVQFRFVPPHRSAAADEEIELSEADLDDIEYTGTSFDLGEAVAQSLALAIDPFAVGPNAEQARKDAGIMSEGAAGAFAALAGLKLNPEG